MFPAKNVSRERYVSLARALLVCAFVAVTQATPPSNALAAVQRTDEKSAPTESAQVAPVPLAEISAQADAVIVNLREIAGRARGAESWLLIEKELPALAREVDGRTREHDRTLAQRPSLDLMRTLERSWEPVQRTLAGWSDLLTARITALDRDLKRIDGFENTWKQTFAASKEEAAPAELLQRIEAVLASVASARKSLEAQRASALRLQGRVSAQDFRVREALEGIRNARAVTLNRILSRDSPALWDREWRDGVGQRIAEGSQETREAQWAALRSYASEHSDRIFLHLVVFAVLARLLYSARRRLTAWVKQDAGLERAAAVVAYPVASALVLALIISRWMYPQAPRLLWAIVGALALVPAVLMLRRIAAPYLLPLLYAVLVFFAIDQMRTVTASIELVPRLIFLIEMIGGAFFLLWFLEGIGRASSATPRERHSRILQIGVRLACAVFVATAAANAVGYVALSNLLGNAVLRSMSYGLVLYAVVQILDALIVMALRVRPLTLSAMVRRHRELLRRRLKMLLNAGALVLLTLFALDRLALRDRALDAIETGLTTELSVREISLSSADVLAFALAVWAAFLVSRFVRFVLDEEVFPHARLQRGLPYAISRSLHYAILVAGFVIAMSAIGLDMTKFTILAGAFTVGVGFGLQNIFNNFVSGLILLFERPLQVGDMIQMDDATGIVERIGIRASVVRAANGSQVIVPNGKLISERVVNWTFAGNRRGLEISIAAVLGTDPAQVISIVERVASDHPNVLDQPRPRALLTRLGPDWMGFELRASTDQVEEWMKVRSDLSVRITAALKEANITLR